MSWRPRRMSRTLRRGLEVPVQLDQLKISIVGCFRTNICLSFKIQGGSQRVGTAIVLCVPLDALYVSNATIATGQMFQQLH